MRQMDDFTKALETFAAVSAPPIGDAELAARIAGLQARLRTEGVKAVWLDASSSLRYYTGLSIGLSERVHGALIPATGAPIYVSPQFEVPKLETMLRLAGEILPWEEHEDPCTMIAARLATLEAPGQGLALDPATPFRFAGRLGAAVAGPVVAAEAMIAAQRQIKSAAEIAIIQTAMDASWLVQKTVHGLLRPGLSTTELCDFVDEAHRRLGLAPLFVAVQFGEATAYPHGVPYPQILTEGDMVLVDLGGILNGYRSDITRSYVFGTPTPRQRAIWEAERRAHGAAFAAATLGTPCEAVDAAARELVAQPRGAEACRLAAHESLGVALVGLQAELAHALDHRVDLGRFAVGGELARQLGARVIAPGEMAERTFAQARLAHVVAAGIRPRPARGQTRRRAAARAGRPRPAPCSRSRGRGPGWRAGTRASCPSPGRSCRPCRRTRRPTCRRSCAPRRGR